MSTDQRTDWSINPFPGLRPFHEEEEHLFFGRESQVDTMVDRLAVNKFLAVVGTSGSGKSSLVNCGLIPALHGGSMTMVGSDWRIAKFRPGNDPIGEMANALAADNILFQNYKSRGLELGDIIETTLRMSKLGLIDIFKQAKLEQDANLLVIVDQFEELFRYRQLENEGTSDYKSEVIAFVNLILEAAEQSAYPIYVVITMRSDFLGDCSEFPGLAEAISSGQYLVPRLTREERRSAIRDPIKMVGAEISPVLLTRLVNDVGDNPDQLSILQHALNRTWAYWVHEGGAKGPIDISHYKAIGTMAEALDNHAEKAYYELPTARLKKVCERVFKALTNKASDMRGIRRPTKLDSLCEIAKASVEEIETVMDVFRKPSRSFLMPPAGVSVNENTVIDISHESLMRVWKRLSRWADEEAKSAQMYLRLVNTSKLHLVGRSNLWRDPDLQLALDWQEEEKPTLAWAKQYSDDYDLAVKFLSQSENASNYEEAEGRFQRNSVRIRNFTIFLVLAILVMNLNKLISTKSIDKINFHQEAQLELRDMNFVVLPDSAKAKIDSVFRNQPKFRSVSIADELDALDLTKLNASLNKHFKKQGHDKNHITKALEKHIVPLRNVVVLENTFSSNDSIDIFSWYFSPKLAKVSLEQRSRLNRTYNFDLDQIFAISTSLAPMDSISRQSKYIQIFEQNGIVFLHDSIIRELPLSYSTLYLMPDKADVVLPMHGQSGIIRSVSRSDGIKEKFLHNARFVPIVDNLGLMIIHVLGYFILIFFVGIIYRKLAFNPTGLAPLDKLRRWFASSTKKLVEYFNTSQWKLIYALSFLFASVIFTLRWLLLEFNFWMPLLAFITLLLVPFKYLLKPALALRIRLTQGTLLKIFGFYLLIYSLVNFLDEVSTVQDLYLSVLGLALILIGYNKSRLSPEEQILRFPGRAPVLYYRSSSQNISVRKGLLYKPNLSYSKNLDKRVLRRVFKKVGPFLNLNYHEDIIPISDQDQSSREKEKPFPSKELVQQAAFVILQIDRGTSDYIVSKIKRALQILKSQQLILYFSLKIEGDELDGFYKSFRNEAKKIFPEKLPKSLDRNRIIAFEDNWQPHTFGQIYDKPVWWAEYLPLIARLRDTILKRISFKKSIKPLLIQRNSKPLQVKLFGDKAISVAGFHPFGFGIPAGIMMCINLWQVNKRWLSILGLILPFLVFVLLIFGYGGIYSVAGTKHETVAFAFLFLFLLGSPFITYWLWLKLRGPEIRDHFAFGGASKPWWLRAVLILGLPLLYLSLFIPDSIGSSYEYTYTAGDYVRDAHYFASYGDKEQAMLYFEDAQKLNPNIDLDPDTEELENDPEKVFNRLFANSKIREGVSLAQSGETATSIMMFEEALELNPEADLNPETEEVENDPRLVTAKYRVQEGVNLAHAGNVQVAIDAFTQAQQISPGIDLDPETEEVENNPFLAAERIKNEAPGHQEAFELVLLAYDLAVQGEIMAAYDHWQKASELRPGMDLDPTTTQIENDRDKLAASFFTDHADQLARGGETLRAEEAYSNAMHYDQSLSDKADFWNGMAWNYCLGGHPEMATDPSEDAVRLARESVDDLSILAYSLDTRGLARALNKNYKGAIEDFKAAIADENFVFYAAKRREWVKALENGEDPFTPEVLESLKFE